MDKILNRGTGLLWIEAINSNANGDPDQDGEPRRRGDGLGEISPVSFKHKIRELIADKEGPIWQEISQELGISEDDEKYFRIMEDKGTKREEINKLTAEEIKQQYWDVRVFGATFLEKKEFNDSFIRTGVVQFGLGVSLSPVEIERLTTTKVLPAEKDKDKGMAPLAYRIVPYGLYMMPFFVNATMARRSGCTPLDIDLLLRILPFAYQETASYPRSQVNIRHAFYVEHAKPRGCYSDFDILEALTPEPLHPGEPAASIRDYDTGSVEERIASLNEKMQGRAGPVIDLMEHI